MSDEISVHTLADNIFHELALPDATDLSPRVDLAFILTQEIRSRELTQASAAALLGVSQPDVSNLMRGNVDGFSQERLERLLNKLDMDIRIQISRRPRGTGEAGVTVELVS